MDTAARPIVRSAVAVGWLVAIAALGALVITAPWVWRIPLAVLFVLALRYVGTRPALAEWAFVRWPALISSATITMLVAYLAVYGVR